MTRHRVTDPRGSADCEVLCLNPGWPLRPFQSCPADRNRCPVHSRYAWAMPRTYPRAVWVARSGALPAAARRLPLSREDPSKIVGIAPTQAFQRWCRARGALAIGGLFAVKSGPAPMVFSEAYEDGLEESAAAAGLRTYCLALAAAYVDKVVTIGMGLLLVVLITGRLPQTWGEAAALVASGVAIMVLSAFLYYWGAVTLFGATVGQGLVGIRIVDERGGMPGPRRALVRELAGTVPRYVPGVGHFVRLADYSWLLLSGGTQLLRDCAAGTRLSVRRNAVTDLTERWTAGLLARLSRRRAAG